MRNQPLVDVVELLDQRLDAVVVERERLHRGDDVVLELLVFAVLRRRELGVLQPVGDVLVLQAAQLLVVVGDRIERLEHARLELGLHGRERDVVLHVVVVEVRRQLAFRPFALGRSALGLLAALPALARQLRRILAVGAGIGRFEIDDVAQQDLAFVEFVAPDDDRLEGQRALAEPGDHRLAAGLDALGDGDLALAGEQLDRAHLAQIHPHGIVGALGRLQIALDLDGQRRARGVDEIAALGLLLVAVGAGARGRALLAGGFRILVVDDVDALLAELAEHVLDLLGGELLRGQDLVQFVIGDIAALLGELDHPPYGLIGQIEQRAIGSRGGFRHDLIGLFPFAHFRRHQSALRTLASPWLGASHMQTHERAARPQIRRAHPPKSVPADGTDHR